MASAGTEGTWEKYDTFLNWFSPEVKQLFQRLGWIKDKIGRPEMFSDLIMHV